MENNKLKEAMEERPGIDGKVFEIKLDKDFYNQKDVLTMEEPKTLKTKVFEALGEVSMCWSETPKGIFDSTNAERIGNELIKEIDSYVNNLYSKSNLIDKNISVKQAVEILCNALREDKNKELFYKCFDEEYKLQFNSKPIIHSKEIALEAAKNFLNLLISNKNQ